jgi:hypothetical protein
MMLDTHIAGEGAKHGHKSSKSSKSLESRNLDGRRRILRMVPLKT